MKRLFIFLIVCVAGQFTISESWAQTDNHPRSAATLQLQNYAMASRMSQKGYAEKNPAYLVSAALLLAENPVKGLIQPDSVQLENAVDTKSTGIPESPVILLNDALKMAGDDSTLIEFINHSRAQIEAEDGLPRGRKFSPLIREFIMTGSAKVNLWATFNANEIAEVYVMGGGSGSIDLNLYDNKGKLIASDLRKMNDCYISFTPAALLQFRIEIVNHGNGANHCLLMTN
jgi:hypothetical protein